MDYKEIEKRIDELNLDGYKHIKNNDWELPQNLIKWLSERDFIKIGRGIASEVYESQHENFVVKINRGYVDPGYLKFVEFCQSNKGNPHLPKLGKIKKYEDWYIIFIEKLEPITDEEIGVTDCFTFFNKLIDYYQYVRPDNFSFEEIFAAIWKNNSNRLIPGDSEIHQYEEITKLMFSFKKKYNYDSLDLHSGNIMRRGDTLVIIDPALI